MTVEASTYINTLNASYPAATDPKSEGDDHIRAIKSAVKLTFPNVTGPVTATQSELNSVTEKVTGPASATANALAKFDGTTGKLVKVSGLVEDAAGNVGLGVTPSAWSGALKAFDIGNSGSYLTGGTTTYSGTAYAFLGNNAYFSAGSNWVYKQTGSSAQYRQFGGEHQWHTAPSGTAGNAITFTQAMTLDASSNLKIAGKYYARRSSGALDLPVLCYSDGVGGSALTGNVGDNVAVGTAGAGDLLFVVSNSSVGRFDTNGNLLLTDGAIGRPAADAGIRFTTDGVIPSRATGGAAAVDNVITLGTGSYRWSTIYAGTGTINTSDAREKTPVRVMAVDEIEAAKALSKEIGVYQFLDSVAVKGDKARHHIGMTVQRAIQIMEAHGLNPFAYGFICYDKWDEQVTEHPAIEARAAVDAKAAALDAEGNVIEPAVEAQPAIEARAAWTEVTLKAGDRYSFRYDQLTLFIARGLHARLEVLEAK